MSAAKVFSAVERQMSLKKKSCWRRWCPRRCGFHLIQGPMPGIAPRDVHFDRLADQHFPGRKWDDISNADQVQLLRDALRVDSFLIDPDAPYMRCWDMVVLSCLFFTALVTPFEV